MSPVPDAASPMPGAEFVQEYVVVPPALIVENITSNVLSPLHHSWFTG